MNPRPLVLGFACFLLIAGCASSPTLSGSAGQDGGSAGGGGTGEWESLFPQDGVPRGWIVRSWNDVSQPAPPNARWIVSQGILRGSTPRGTWLVSQREYGDFILEFDFKLAERGNSGVGLRLPPSGDPAIDGLELQLVDPRYYGTNYTARPVELTGALCNFLPPTAQAFRPLDWNECRVTCRGSGVKVVMNGTEVLDADLARQTAAPSRGRPLSERPRKGRLAFQELSRGGGQVLIRNARVRVFE